MVLDKIPQIVIWLQLTVLDSINNNYDQYYDVILLLQTFCRQITTLPCNRDCGNEPHDRTVFFFLCDTHVLEHPLENVQQISFGSFFCWTKTATRTCVQLQLTFKQSGFIHLNLKCISADVLTLEPKEHHHQTDVCGTSCARFYCNLSEEDFLVFNKGCKM